MIRRSSWRRTIIDPTNRSFASLDDGQQAALRSNLEQLWSEYNRATDGTTQVEDEYLEVIARRS